MKVLVTGGAGYIGSVVVAYLLDKGINVNVIDNLSTGKIDLVDDRSTFFEGDILNTDFLKSSMYGCDAVIHLAAKSIVGESISQPELYNKINYLGTKNILEIMTEQKIKTMIFSSTCAVYGQDESGYISESTQTNPINPYGESKLLSDAEIRKHSEKFKLNTYSFRFFNVAGSYKNLNGQFFGELHENETHLIPNILNNNKVTVYGTDWNTPDGTCIRDYVHVKDIANAIYIALLTEHTIGHKIYNLSSGTGYSVFEIITAANKVLPREVKITQARKREGDAMILVGKSELAFRDLGWKCNSNIDEVIKDSYEFIRTFQTKNRISEK
jgi:UDP-glucose 4-epimerase